MNLVKLYNSVSCYQGIGWFLIFVKGVGGSVWVWGGINIVMINSNILVSVLVFSYSEWVESV